jgi:hypothetical protein
LRDWFLRSVRLPESRSPFCDDAGEAQERAVDAATFLAGGLITGSADARRRAARLSRSKLHAGGRSSTFDREIPGQPAAQLFSSPPGGWRRISPEPAVAA